MSFDRFRAQTVCENLLGCTSFDDFYSVDFPSLVLDSASAYTFRNSLKEDARDLFYKGYLTLLEGLNGFYNKNYSWAVIKCYYSVFYMIRADLALRDYGLIRHKSIYYLEAKEGAKPITKGNRGSNRSKYSGDHKSSLNYYKDLFSGSDLLLSQNIDDLDVYEWLMKKREQVNYQERYFNDPNNPQFLNYIASEIIAGNFELFINEIMEDNFIKTFQPEFAPIAIPIKRLMLTKTNFEQNNILFNYLPDQVEHLKTFQYHFFFGVTS